MDQDTEKIISGGLLKFVRFTIWVLCSWTILLSILTVIGFIFGFINGFMGWF
ncbi:hypothetical protein AGMMS49990_06020 [Endomicrobiia bacterium]|nr:hypothetical protein AGMMS49990_06020 [Endomicrobiia bacterium]